MSKLIECKTCKKEFAKSAKNCPHCGEKNPTLQTKEIVGAVFFIGVLIFWFSSPSENQIDKDYKETTLKRAKTMSSITLNGFSKEYVKEKNLPTEYENKFIDCLGQLVHEKNEDLKIEKILEWCQADTNMPDYATKTYYNTARLYDDFSSWDGSYIPLENTIKSNMKNSSSYKHISTLHNLAYHGNNITPHMNIKTVFEGSNDYGGIVKTTVTAKVNAITKELYDIKDE